MYHRGTVQLPLHTGKAPWWLVNRMQRLAAALSAIFVEEYGTKTYLQRLADPYWFHAYGNVLGFDFHSSGLTTTLTGVLKQAINKQAEELGMYVAGGKGKTSKKTPEEINQLPFAFSEKKREYLISASKMTAKIDNAVLQDSYQLYHHTFIVDRKGYWITIQQGMNSVFARRYHWQWQQEFFAQDPKKEQRFWAEATHEQVLDLTHKASEDNRKTMVDLVNDNPSHLRQFFSKQTTLSYWTYGTFYKMPQDHYHLQLTKQSWKTLQHAYEIQPSSFQELIALQGMGPKTIRALSLISELFYGKPASWQDPAKFSYAVGGKDGVPYPVNKQRYDQLITLFEHIKQTSLPKNEQFQAIKRLHYFLEGKPKKMRKQKKRNTNGPARTRTGDQRLVRALS